MSPRVLLAAAALAGLFALTVSLGNWQLRRAQEKSQIAAQRERALASAPIEIGAQPVAAGPLDAQRVAATGEFDAAETVLLDNRTYKGRAGFFVLTPLRLDPASGMRVVVLRGWVERDPRGPNVVPAFRTPAGVVRIEGLGEARLAQAMVLSAQVEPQPGQRIWQQFDLEQFQRLSRAPIQPLIVRQLSDSADGLVRDWPIAANDVDKHRGYALQWFLMAATVVILALALGLRQLRGGFRS